MRGLLVAIGLVVAPFKVLALTWDFDAGTTWGWAAQESAFGSDHGTTTVYSEVADGVWRIAPVPHGKRPAIRLLSPLIGEDSDLFDWVTLRLRIIHDLPTEGVLEMSWSNVEYRRRKKEEPSVGLGFFVSRPQVYSTEWEDITIDIRALEAAPAGEIDWEVTWEDTLFHFFLDLDLLHLHDIQESSLSPAARPTFVEVDWIQLTGAEELLLGELQPRASIVEAGLPGTLFAEPRFSVLGRNIGNPGSHGTLGDVDGDGDADLVVKWEEIMASDGWSIATSDGLGSLVPTQEVLLPQEAYSIPMITGGDFDGDGLLDLAFSTGRTIELWLNRGEDGFETILQLSDSYFIGLADGDGDGDVDLLAVEDRDDLWSNLTMWINDGAGGFAHSDRFVLDTEEELGRFLLAGQPEGEAVRVLWIRPCWKPQGPWRLTQPWAANEEPPLFFELGEVNPCDMDLLADLDGDGAVELVGTPERNLFPGFSRGNTHHGLALWRVNPSGGVERHTLLGPQVIVPYSWPKSGVIASDLTGDGLLDLAVINTNLAMNPALIVLVGQRDGLPVVEGHYPLPTIGRSLLAGDVNGDGATDLVVLGRSQRGDGGAFVFLNQGVPATAIAAETTTMPTTFALGANYPNPFNPATTIPVSVAVGAGEVDLTIYNVLGQPVRRVWAGSLAAGEHRLAWDGRDTQGQPVAAGVYLYRLQVGDQTRIRKMVKIE